MQVLEVEFTDRTFTYTQIERRGDIALYAQCHRLSGVVRYEVVKIRVAPPHTWPTGHTTPEHEAYPGSTTWGRMGWTFYTREAAQRWALVLASRQTHDGAVLAQAEELQYVSRR